MDFCLYLKPQSLPEQPAHRISRSWANRILSERVGRKVGQNAVQLTVDLTWRELKQSLRINITGQQIRMKHSYIPEYLPMAELPGIRFVPPNPKPFEMPRFV